MPTIPLEDNYEDILAKALRGRKLTRDGLAAQLGLDPAAVRGLFDGEFDEATARHVAPVLELGAERLVAIARRTYHPVADAPEGLLGFNTPYEDYFVNAYLVWDPHSRQAIAFDTGSDCTAMLEAARERELTIALILLTHTHRDHIMALEALKAATGATAYVSREEPTPGAEAFEPGRRFEAGALAVESRRTTGHSRGGTSYVVNGLATPLVVVGDALFAGSMGGGIVSYEDALANNRRELLSLAAETIVCPGHGPLTTVGQERRHNPFYPELN